MGIPILARGHPSGEPPTAALRRDSLGDRPGLHHAHPGVRGICPFRKVSPEPVRRFLTPDLWSPWPTYPAVYFSLAHGGIVIGAAVLVYGRIAPLRAGAVWKPFGWLVAYAAVVGTFNAIFHTNYMYLREKPGNASLLDALGSLAGLPHRRQPP